MGKNIAILASGNGTNAENIIRYFQDKEAVDVKLVLTNRSQAFVLQRAKGLGVPCVYLSKELWNEGKAVLALLRQQQIDFVVLAGFLARVPDLIVHSYPHCIVNLHPSLLPKFGGKGMYGDRVHQAVLESGDTLSGITIHYLNEQYDEGEVIARYTCLVQRDDTVESLSARIHALEYHYYPLIIEGLLTGERQIE